MHLKSTPPTPGPDQPPLLLIVDDDAEMRAYLRESLMRLPARILKASTGADALRQVWPSASDLLRQRR